MPLLKQVKQHKLLLDTHVWIWLMNQEPRFSSSAIAAFNRASEQEGRLFISTISVWELGMLEAKGRIELAMDCLEWVEKSLDMGNLQLVDLTPSIAIRSSRLPAEFHGDPADRILVATAIELGAILTTCDGKVLKFAESRLLSAYNPSA